MVEVWWRKFDTHILKEKKIKTQCTAIFKEKNDKKKKRKFATA